MLTPSPTMIQAVRQGAGLTQAQAAEFVHLGAYQRWAEYERGAKPIDAARWELFLIKCGKHELYGPKKGVPVPTREESVRPVGEVVAALTKPRAKAPATGRAAGPRNRP